MKYSIDAGFILYPVLIALTVCNVSYKLFGFKPVKVPVAIVFALTLFAWFGGFQKTKDLLCPTHEHVVTEMIIKDALEEDIVEDEIVEDDVIDDDGASQA
jgi:branched-subunit amino acid permease